MRDAKRAMEYQENMSRFFVERALDHYQQALVHIEAAIDLCPDTDLLPKLSHYRRDTMRRIPRERKAWWKRKAVEA